MQKTDDLRIKAIHEVDSPAVLHQRHPISEVAAQTVFDSRAAIHRILTREDDRLRRQRSTTRTACCRCAIASKTI